MPRLAVFHKTYYMYLTLKQYLTACWHNFTDTHKCGNIGVWVRFPLWDPGVGFLVAVLDVGTIFEVKFQHVRAQNMSF